MELLAVLAIILIIITPILAIAAFVRVQRIAEQLRGASLLTLGDRLSALERRLQTLEKPLSSQPASSQESKPVGSQPVPSAPPLPRLLPPRRVPRRRFLFHSSPIHARFLLRRRSTSLPRLRFTALSQSHRPTSIWKL